MRDFSLIRVMLTASILPFHRFDIYRYESRLCLIVCLSITIEFVNWRKDLRYFFISSDLLVGHTSLFRMVVDSLFRSFRKRSHSNSKWSVV